MSRRRGTLSPECFLRPPAPLTLPWLRYGAPPRRGEGGSLSRRRHRALAHYRYQMRAILRAGVDVGVEAGGGLFDACGGVGGEGFGEGDFHVFLAEDHSAGAG